MLVVRTAPVPVHFAIHTSPALGKYALIIVQTLSTCEAQALRL